METGPWSAARAGRAGRGFRLAPSGRGVLPAHMRGGAEARSRRSRGAVGSGPGFPGPGARGAPAEAPCSTGRTRWGRGPSAARDRARHAGAARAAIVARGFSGRSAARTPVRPQVRMRAACGVGAAGQSPRSGPRASDCGVRGTSRGGEARGASAP